MNIRHVEPADYVPLIAVVDDWWGGRPKESLLNKISV